ncbi:MAG: ATP synthase F1 subunit gamma [Deltaproteobacteria bacterium]|jgi:F-type H+-transporting ATPase subunit gamma|nr:ATP synthase F1 subunit gamma [Deltaproteobacteria bacterium]
MSSLKEIKQHIVAVRQTQKLTKAMNMVAAAKLRSTQSKAESYEEYADELVRLLAEIGKRTPILAETLYKPAKDSDRVLLVVLTSDRGLCGSFNFNVIHKTNKAILDIRKRGLKPCLIVIGRKGLDYYNREKMAQLLPVKFKVKGNPDGQLLKPGFPFEHARKLSDCLIGCFMTGYKEIYVVYTSFLTLNKHPVEILPLLPLASINPEPKTDEKTELQPAPLDADKPQDESEVSAHLDFTIEPDPEELLKFLIPNSLATGLYRASLDSVTAENAARMQAMDNATKSCSDIIQSLTMAFNKARQASVTNELLDIVNGAEALKG